MTPVPPEVRAQIVREAQDVDPSGRFTISVGGLARKYHVSRPTVWNILRAAGVPQRPIPPGLARRPYASAARDLVAAEKRQPAASGGEHLRIQDPANAVKWRPVGAQAEPVKDPVGKAGVGRGESCPNAACGADQGHLEPGTYACDECGTTFRVSE